MSDRTDIAWTLALLPGSALALAALLAGPASAVRVDERASVGSEDTERNR